MNTDNSLSNCCGAPPIGEIHDGFALCSECHDHAEFPPTCPQCDGQMEETTDHDLPRSRATVRTGWKCLDCGHNTRLVSPTTKHNPKPERPEKS